MEITLNSINQMSYTDFVGMVNQTNVMPGAYDTISRWIQFGKITSNSKVLEMACTTGFSLREISLETNCSGLGVDISQKSVDTANENRLELAPNNEINYKCISGYDVEGTDYSHIVLGAAARFFPDPQKLILKCTELLCDNSYILASEFYAKSKVPEDLIKNAQNTFGITPTSIDYKEVMSIYKGLDIVYEDKKTLTLETDDEISHYCQSTINRACNKLGITDLELQNAMIERLKKIKQVSNELRKYQEYNVLVLRYRKNTFPNRYVELF